MITQIYEIQSPQEAEKCIELGVDQIGSVLLSRDSWKDPAIKEVAGLTEGTSTKHSIIPLFSETETIFKAMEYYRPGYVHFCESPMDEFGNIKSIEKMIESQLKFKEHFPEIGIISTVPMPSNDSEAQFSSLEIGRKFARASDLILADTWLGKEPVTGFIGITNTAGNWDVARELSLELDVPVLLAGGLSPENVYDAILKVTPFGVDSCSGTNFVDETGKSVRFRKDFEKLARFMDEVRRARETLELKKREVKEKLEKLKEELKEREAALPAHSVKPQQIILLEEIEDEVSSTQREYEHLGEILG